MNKYRFPFNINRAGPMIFVEFHEKLIEWTPEECDAYKKELQNEIRKTLSPDDYRIFSCKETFPNEFQDLIHRVKSEIMKEFQIQENEISIAKYHGDQTLFYFSGDTSKGIPYLFKGFQIRIYKE